MNQNQRRVLWDHVALAGIALLFIGIAVWWLESRFGAGIAVLSLGLLFGVGIYMFGNIFGWRSAMRVMKETQTSSADMLHEVGKALEHNAKANAQIANRENAYIIQMERDAGKYVNRLAHQQAKLLTAVDEEEDVPVYLQQRQQQPGQQTGFTIYE